MIGGRWFGWMVYREGLIASAVREPEPSSGGSPGAQPLGGLGAVLRGSEVQLPVAEHWARCVLVDSPSFFLADNFNDCLRVMSTCFS